MANDSRTWKYKNSIIPNEKLRRYRAISSVTARDKQIFLSKGSSIEITGARTFYQVYLKNYFKEHISI